MGRIVDLADRTVGRLHVITDNVPALGPGNILVTPYVAHRDSSLRSRTFPYPSPALSNAHWRRDPTPPSNRTPFEALGIGRPRAPPAHAGRRRGVPGSSPAPPSRVKCSRR